MKKIYSEHNRQLQSLLEKSTNWFVCIIIQKEIMLKTSSYNFKHLEEIKSLVTWVIKQRRISLYVPTALSNHAFVNRGYPNDLLQARHTFHHTEV